MGRVKNKNKMNTTENNKIIAEFMGLRYKGGEWYSTDNETEHFAVYANIIKNEPEEDLFRFHNDWNWLMEVIEKIEGLKAINYLSGRNWIGFDVRIYKTFNTQTHYCTIKYLKSGGDMTISNGFSKSNKIEAVYNACVKFIKWYNEQKSA